MPLPDGRVGHAEFKFGDSCIMLADEFPEGNVVGPKTLGNSRSACCFTLTMLTSRFQQSHLKGGKIKKPVADQFYGDRTGQWKILRPQWTIAMHKEDVTPEEMKSRMAAMAAK